MLNKFNRFTVLFPVGPGSYASAHAPKYGVHGVRVGNMLKSSLPVVIDILSFVIYTTSLLMVIYIFDWQAPNVHELLLHLTVAFERTDLESRDFLFVLDFTLAAGAYVLF